MTKKKQQQNDGEIKFYTEEIKKSKSINEDTVKLISFIVVLVIVLGLFGLLFYLNGKYVTKDKYQDETTTTTTTPIYDETQTTVDTMFNLSKDTYYVLAYDPTDELDGQHLYSLTTNNLGIIPIYTLDLTNAMNKAYYNKDKETNVKATKAADITFKSNALIEFKKGKISQIITEVDKIEELLNKKTSN